MPTEFQLRLYEKLKEVPKGNITTYRELAHSIGTRAYRAVGVAMRENPFSKVPCHRVVSSDGRIGGFRGRTTGEAIADKIAMLAKEGILVKEGRVVDFKKVLYHF